MNVIETNLPGVLLIEPRAFHDARGYFFETWNQAKYAEKGLTTTFVQDNVSSSSKGVLRGLHLQWPAAQAKLVTVLEGEVYDVAVDVRRGSPTFGQSFGALLSSENHRHIFIPEGFAHGFVVTSERATFLYKCSKPYTPSDEITVLWSDPDLHIDWPITDPILSPKDIQGLRLKDIPAERLPAYSGGGRMNRSTGKSASGRLQACDAYPFG